MMPSDFRAADSRAPIPPSVAEDQATEDNRNPVGRTLEGGLRVLEHVGLTPEGPLYKARYPNDEVVALVLIGPAAAGGEHTVRDRFRRATQIQHPNVAAVYKVGEMPDGSTYVVLEQVVGEPLSGVLAAGTVFGLQEAVDLVLQAAAGLQAAYRAGFVHGSLSPRTILVGSTASAQRQVKLTGFSPVPDPHEWEAKPHIPREAVAPYASPERLLGQLPDERSEVFSLGAVLHHLLTGRPPDSGPDDGFLPDPARAVLESALAPDPDQRFQTIAELAEALARLPSSAATPRRRSLHPVRVVGAVAASLALGAAGMWLLPRATGRATNDQRPPVVTGTAPLEADGAPRRSVAAEPRAARQDSLRMPDDASASGGSPSEASTAPRPRTSRPRSAADSAGRTVAVPTRREEPQPRATRPSRPEGSRPVAQEPAPEVTGNRLGTERRTTDVQSGRSAVRAPVTRPPATSSGASPPRPAEKPETPRARESRDPPEALGYVGDPLPPSTAKLPPGDAGRGDGEQTGASPDIRTAAQPRARAELLRNEGLEASLGDLMRLGIAEDFAEVRPGTLLVSLTETATHVPSFTYNLQQLYLAYSAATEHHPEAALELRRGGSLYGRFTRAGLRLVGPE